MAIEILEHGTPPKERKYTIRCHSCATRFRFTQEDGKITHDQRDGSYIGVQCPVCDMPLTKEAYKYDR